MNRKQFLYHSAIVGAGLAAPRWLFGQSGLVNGNGGRKVFALLQSEKTMVGTLPVMRAFAGDHVDHVSPFVLFDEFGPVQVEKGKDALKVEAHPHAGVTPTTFFLAGSGHHKDSLDYDFQIETGEYMMFHSGRGAIHMEESGQALKENGGTIHGFQIWLNMPSRHKWDAPSTLVHRGEVMPTIIHPAYEARVVLGELFGYKSTVETFSPAFYYHIKMKPGARLDIPVDPTHNAFAYCVKGVLELEEQLALAPNQIALYQRGEQYVRLYTLDGAELFLLGGQPLNEVVYSYGPFVMNTEDEIRRCIHNYQTGRMGDPRRVN